MKKTFVKLLAMMLVVVFATLTLASCGAAPSSNPEKAEAALEKKGYNVEVYDDAFTLGIYAAMLGTDDIECVVRGNDKDDKNESVIIFYFGDKDDVDAAWDAVEELAEENENEDIIIKKSGKMIWMGTKKAIKAAK